MPPDDDEPIIRINSSTTGQAVLAIRQQEIRQQEILRISPEGDIFVRGVLVENDHEVVDALRYALGLPHSWVPSPDSPAKGAPWYDRLEDVE